MSNVQAAIEHVQANKASILESLRELVSIPSVSTLSEHKPDLQRAAEWLRDHLQRIGMHNTEIFQTQGSPVVYADYLQAGDGRPTALVYGHYDVQPADPLDEWDTPPFEPTVRGEYLYGRGASDMKGQIVVAITALAALKEHGGGIPLNVKFLLEGEEEVGSPNLRQFIDEHRDLLAADFSLNPDSGIVRPDLPAIVYGLRGLAYFELWVYGPESDLHSGIFGGVVHNPALVLSALIAGLHDEEGRVTLPGFYDKVRTPSDEERQDLARLPYGDEQVRRMAANPPALFGEAGFSNAERIGARPTLDVNGLYSGFIGEGSKTVLPAKAMAKISMRLVPHQDPADVAQQLRAYLEQHAPPTVRWEIKEMVHGRAVLVDRNSAQVRAAGEALRTAFGVAPVFRLEGGSIPVVGMVQDVLGIETVLLGFGLPDDNVHAPNEHLHLPTFFRGIEAHVHFLANVGRRTDGGTNGN